LKNLFPDVAFRFQIGPGARGVDVIVPPRNVSQVGFPYAEIKPLSASGQRTLARQIQNWGYDPSQVQAITYDAFGNVYFGF
jgi:hypothetical protein